MKLPAIKEKLSVASIRKKILFLIFGFLILFLLLMAAEVIYCLNSPKCFIAVCRSSPILEKLLGIQETELVYKKGPFSLSKELNQISVSGEIIDVERDRLILKATDGSEKTFLIKEGSKFILVYSPLELGSNQEEYTFDGENLSEFLLEGYFIISSHLENSKISSEFISVNSSVSGAILVSKTN